eukprot:7054266-Pyramimonas_sp.AAC.1
MVLETLLVRELLQRPMFGDRLPRLLDGLASPVAHEAVGASVKQALVQILVNSRTSGCFHPR